MNNTTFVSIKSVLYDLSTVLPEQEFDRVLLTEWAHKALRKVHSSLKYESEVCLINVEEHKGQLPSDLKYLTQMAYKPYDDVDSNDLEAVKKALGIDLTNNTEIVKNLPDKAVYGLTNLYKNKWRPLRASTNSFFQSITCPTDIYPDMYFDYDCPHCKDEYYLSPDLSITTSFKKGLVMLAYLRYAKDTEGYELVPDEPNILEALFHYCLYRYYTVKALVKEQGAQQEREYHLARFETLLAKGTANMNTPDVSQMENLRIQSTRLIPKSRGFDSFFSKLNSQEIEPNFLDAFRQINHR